MRTFVNIQAGGKTRLSGAVHAVVLLILALIFSVQVSYIPLAVLGGILLRVGLDIIDWRNLKRITRLPRPGVVVMLTTMLLTVFVDLLTAVAAGIVMTSVLFISKTARAQMESIRFTFGDSGELKLNHEEQRLLNELGEKVFLLQVEGPLSFITARDITRMMQLSPENDVLIFDLSKVPFIDSSAAASLEEAMEQLTENGDHIIIIGARPRVLETLKKTSVYEAIGEAKFVSQYQDALSLAGRLITRA